MLRAHLATSAQFRQMLRMIKGAGIYNKSLWLGVKPIRVAPIILNTRNL